MKIPTSSSILLATLAMSSSSSSLIATAPAGNSSSYTGMTSSTSNNHVSSLHERTAYLTELDMKGTSERAVSHRRLDSRDSLMDSLMDIVPKIPLAGEALRKILGSLFVTTRGPTGAKSMDVDGAGPNIDPQDMQALQTAIAELSRTLNSTAPQGDNSGTPNSGSSTATPENAAAKDGADASSASSPPIPGNPPNSPINASLPVDV